MADANRRALESAGSAAAAGAVIGSFIPGIGTLLGASIGGLYGAVTGYMSASEENAQLSSAEELAKNAINDASAKLAAANAEQKAALEEFINGQKNVLNEVRVRKQKLAEEVAAAEKGGIAEEEKQIDKGFEGLRGALKQQEGGLDVVRQLQLEGIRQREALLGTEESAARRITAPGGLLERQQQQNALARAQAMQKARLGGPAARAALMGQFATQGAQLGMQAQQDIADAQRRVREGRMGFIGEQTSAELERQRGLMDIYGRRGTLDMDQARSAAGFTGRRTGAEVARLQGQAEADVGYETGLGDLQAQRYNTLTDLRNEAAGREAGQVRDLSDTQLSRLAREQELNAAASQRNLALIQSSMGLAAANPAALSGNALPNWASGLFGGGGDAGAKTGPVNQLSPNTFGSSARQAQTMGGLSKADVMADQFVPGINTRMGFVADPVPRMGGIGPGLNSPYEMPDAYRPDFYPTPTGRPKQQYGAAIGPGMGDAALTEMPYSVAPQPERMAYGQYDRRTRQPMGSFRQRRQMDRTNERFGGLY